MSVKDKKTGRSLFPSWKDLLLSAADFLAREGKTISAKLIRTQIETEIPKNYLAAANVAKDELGSPRWFEFLKTEIDLSRELVEDGSLEMAKKVWCLGSRLIVTTNYDRVLDWSCPYEYKDQLDRWIIEAPYEQPTSLKDGVKNPTIWYLHGRIDNVEKLILTPKGYHALYSSENEERGYRAALKHLQIVLASRTFLFIGFSFRDQNFCTQVQRIKDVFKDCAGPHYVLITESQEKSIKGLDLPLIPITYTDHENLSVLLDELGQFTDSTENNDSTNKGDHTISQLAAEKPDYEVPFNLDNPIFYIPYRSKGNGVVGRDKAISLVRKQLLNGTPTAIGHAAAFRGMGGLGKTQLAVEYAHSYRKQYTNGVIWINADQDIKVQLIRIATVANWISERSDRSMILATATQRLRSFSNCLLIFDNVESLDSIKQYFPKSNAQPHLLITSRADHPGFSPIPLELLTTDLSLVLLANESSRDLKLQNETERNFAIAIVEELGGLPLAIEIAGAFLKFRATLTFERYHELLVNNLKIATSGKNFFSFTGHEQDLFRTLQISETVLEQEPLLKDILLLLSWSASSFMSISLISAILNEEEPMLYGPVALGIDLRILNKAEKSDSYDIHRLIRHVQQEQFPLTEREAWVEQICHRLGNWFQDRRKSFNNLQEFEAELDHLEQWNKHAERFNSKEKSRLTWLQSYPSYHLGNYRLSDTTLQKAQKQFEENNADLTIEALILSDLGSIKDSLHKYQEALAYYQKSLALLQELVGDKDRDTARCFNNIGSAFGNLGNHEKALEYKEKALGIQLTLLTENDPETAASYSNIGISYGKLGNQEKALEYQEKALKIRKNILGENHPDTAYSYSSIASSLKDMGKISEAIENIKKGFLIQKKLLGPQHPHTIISFSIFIGYLCDEIRFKEAFQSHEQFLKIFPKDHPRYRDILNLKRMINDKSTKAGFRAGPPKKPRNPKRKKRR